MWILSREWKKELMIMMVEMIMMYMNYREWNAVNVKETAETWSWFQRRGDGKRNERFVIFKEDEDGREMQR